MVIYLADRRMNILGMASTELMEGYTISKDLKTEDTDTGVATFECTVHWTDDTREVVKAAASAGNYLLRSNNGENEFYTITETEEDTKNQTIYVYAEDAGMDLLNETVGAFAADDAHPAAWYVEMYAEDTGFEIGINEISDLSRKLEWTGTATAAERIASVATQFDNAEISYSFEIKGLAITHKYINIYKKRGKDAGVQLRLNRDVDRIITTTSVADLATALYVTGGIPEGEDDPITLEGYEYDDGDLYVMEGTPILCSRSALAAWSRYVWAKEPNQLPGYTGNIVKQWSYDTTSQSELCNRAITQLSRVCEPAVNYEVEIQMLPENVGIGDYVDIVDEQGELYLNSRILKLTTSICNKSQTATLGEFLIKEGGITETVRELAEQFSQLAKTRQYYIWIAYADDEYGDGISLDPEGKTYMGTCTTSAGATPDISDPSIYKWSLIQGNGIEEIITWYGKSDSPTEVPTVWQEEPYELLHNEYQWSYTETIYNNGVHELTTPHIIAYYDYLAVDELEAQIAYIEEAYITKLDADQIIADEIEAVVAEFDFLTADSAIITNLTAFEANVTALLSGEIGTGELQAIHITTDNAVIESAVIIDALMDTVLASVLTAGVIYTDYIEIANNEDESLKIDGSTIQISDETGVRIQMGLDGDGNYNFYIFSADGTVLWDALGLTEEGLIANGAIIRDVAVADDANISGYKLNIAEVVDIINEDGSLEIDAASVTINGERLDYQLTSINEKIDNLSFEGLKDWKLYFCLWDSPTIPPLDPEDMTPAICGEAICGKTVCGVTDIDAWWPWTEEEPIAGAEEYIWVRYWMLHDDDTEEWGDPFLLTDAYVRSQTSVLQTELEVVQGQITAKIWMSDITETVETRISDLWSQINIVLGDIQLEVGSMSTTVDSLETTVSSLDLQIGSITAEVESISSNVETMETELSGAMEEFSTISDQVSQLVIETGSISSTVAEIEQKIESLEGVKSFSAYFCLWDSAEVAPPDDEDITPAICGIAICGLTICGMTEGTLWSTEESTAGEGQYKWIKYLIEYENDTSEWIGPFCMTDEYSRMQLQTLYSEIRVAYTNIEQLSDSIILQVTEINTEMNESSQALAELTDNVNSYYEVMQTTFTQLADSFNLTISGAIESMAETAEGMQSQLDEYATYFRFAKEGLEIGELNSPFAMLLGATQLSFTESGEVMAYFSNSMLYVYDVQILNTLRIGNFRWQPGTDGNLNLVRVGEVE